MSEGGTHTLINRRPMPPERTRGGGAAPRRASPTHHPRPPPREPEGGDRRATYLLPTESDAQAVPLPLRPAPPLPISHARAIYQKERRGINPRPPWD